MQQVKISFNEKQIEFLSKFYSLGFKDKSSLVRKAIEHFKKEIEIQRLKRPADLYCEIFDEDSELQDLTNSAISDWPE